jgi:hypothetical protein
MANKEDILAENLKHAIAQCHRQIVFGTAAALFLLLLVIPEWRGARGTPIKIPILDLETERVLAEILAAVAFFISGYLAYIAIGRAQRIMERLGKQPEIREAVLLYPSIPTMIDSGMRLTAVLLPLLLFLIATVPFFFFAGSKREGLFVVIMMMSGPSILLAIRLWEPLSHIKYELTERAFEQLRQGGMAKELVASIDAMRDRAFRNRDQFRKALYAANKKLQPKEIRMISGYACEEAWLED